MTETATKKLTKREFDAAANRLFADLERPIGTPIVYDEVRTGDKRDYHQFLRPFEVTGLKTFGLPVVLRGSITLDKDRSRIVLHAYLRFTTERHERTVQDAELWGEYDVYQGRWTLRWL